MDCTQRLECTQDLNCEPYSQKLCPEQIGYLGILGNMYPVNQGPNKIGRDPQTCSIVLDMKSLSRQHAVINVINKKQFMLMDLGSINKTKIGIKTLQPYIPYPLQNGDTVQFGDIFGIFRLCQDETDLPMTQAIIIGTPETPAAHRQVSKFATGSGAASTTVPESPDVSDKDDSFILPSQQAKESEFKSPKNLFLKASGRTIIKPSIGTNLINNDFWNSAQKSPSLKLNLDDSSDSLNDSTLVDEKTAKTVVSINETTKDIHDMDTQVPYGVEANKSNESIYNANTQLPMSSLHSIHSLETQLHLPVVKKIHEQQDMQFELSVANKDNDINVHDAQTQIPGTNNIHNSETQGTTATNDANTQLFEDNDIYQAQTQAMVNQSKAKSINDMNTQLVANKDIGIKPSIHDESTQFFDNNVENKEEAVEEENSFVKKDSKNKIIDEERISESDEELLFGEFHNKETDIEMSFKEQNIVKSRSSSDIILLDDVDANEFDCTDSQPIEIPEMSPKKTSKEEIMPDMHSDSLSPIIGVKRKIMRLDSDSSTDCDDINILPTQKIALKTDGNSDKTDCEDDIVIKPVTNNSKTDINVTSKESAGVSFEEMATQILDEDEPCFEDMPTQIIVEDHVMSEPEEKTSKANQKDDCIEDMATQIIVSDAPKENMQAFSEEIVSPFKIPLLSPRKNRKKDISKLAVKPVTIPPSVLESDLKNDENYYEATQDIFDDLCSQRIPSPISNECEEVVPCSVEDFQVGDRFRHIEDQVSPKKSLFIADRSSSDPIDSEEKVAKYVASLSAQDIKEVVGADVQSVSKKSSSDLSDLEVTPKKYNPKKFMNIELPDSQEIKTGVAFSCQSAKTESSSDSEMDTQDSQECTPILFKRKVRPRKETAKIDLTAKFNANTLPTRVITRVRKPTAKAKESMENDTIEVKTILKPKLPEQEDHIDNDIINENLTRLKNDKKKNTDKSKSLSNSENKKLETQTKRSKDTENKKKMDCKEKSQKPTEKTVSVAIKDEKPEKESVETVNKKSKDNDAKKSKSTKTTTSKSDEKKETVTSTQTAKNNQSKICEFYEKETPNESRRSPRNKTIDKVETKIPIEKAITAKEQINNKNKLKTKEIIELVNLDSDSENNEQNQNVGSTRSTRHRKRTDRKTKSPEKPIEPQKRKYTKRSKKSASPAPSAEETDNIRRSKRQKVSKDSQDSQNDPKIVKLTRSKAKSSKATIANEKKSSPARDQSTVYDISTDSNPESSRKLKRTATEALEVPSPKRTRSVTSNSNVTSSSITSKPLNVLFTAFPLEKLREKIKELGGVIVTDVASCSVLVTLQIKRTFKLLCVIGLGKPIVGPSWVEACINNNKLVDPWQHLMRDQQAEDRFKFNLERTLRGPRHFLQGYNVSSTPSVMPQPQELKMIVECSGGTWREGGQRWVCLSTSKDKAMWPSLTRRGAIVVSTEVILGGVLRQQLEIEANKLR